MASLARVLAEEADSIWLEPWDDSGEGIEFSLRRPGGTDYHQVKRQAPPGRVWTVRSLEQLGVLGAAKSRLAVATDGFMFVSMTQGTLGELIERARHADSLEAFHALQSEATNRTLRELNAAWQFDDDSTYVALQRFDAVVIDEARLLELVTARLTALVRGNSSNVIDVLAAFALDNVHREIHAEELWAHLRSREFTAQEWWRDSGVLARIEEQQARYLAEAERFRIRGSWIRRPETDTLKNALGDSSSRIIVLTGSAGVGKTSVLSQAVADAIAADTPTLPFRVDRLVPTLLPDEVGAQLGLPASPATVLAGRALNRRCLLVIDQVDAVSAASGRNPHVFEVIDEILRQAWAYSQMVVVVACRQYDLENDQRLRMLRDRRDVGVIIVGGLDAESVSAALSAAGQDPAGLTNRQLDVLAIPLNLRLFLTSGASGGRSGFSSVSDLFAAFWDTKVRALRERLGRDPAWVEVIDTLCEAMNSHQVLTAPASVLDAWPADRDALVSEGVLIVDEGRVAFTHEGFFDYAFARRFAGRPGDLPGLLRSQGQRLFHRAQVRQILLHERDVDQGRYLADLQLLLTGDDIRFHIKDTILTLLAAIPNPTPPEWDVLRGSLSTGAEEVRARIRGLIAQTSAWFEFADQAGWFEEAFRAGTDDDIDVLTRILAAAQRSRPDRVTSLLRAHFQPSERWRRRVIDLTVRADLSANRAFFEWFLEQVRAGSVDDLKTPFAVNGTFWDLAYPLKDKAPGWAVELALAYLQRRGELAAAASVSDPFSDREWVPDPIDHDLLPDLGRKAPVEYVTLLLPWMLDVAARTSRTTKNHTYDTWSARFRGSHYGAKAQLLLGMERALEACEPRDHQVFVQALERLEEAPYESANFLLVRALTFGGEAFAARAAEWVLTDAERLRAGYADASHWAGRELLESAGPYLESADLASIEDLILGYFPEYERTADGRMSRNYSQFVLLSGLPEERLKAATRRRLEELRRKFGIQEPDRPRAVQVRRVPPPVPPDAAPRLSDEQWTRAIAKYNREGLSRDEAFELKGGLHELANLLHDETVRDPQRFSRLAIRLPDNAHPAYLDAVLRGIRDVEEPIESEAVFELVRRAHSLPGHPCGRWITDPVGRLAETSLPDDILDLVCWYAAESDDPSPGAPDVIASSDTSPTERLITNGINSARGTAALTIARLLHADPTRRSKLEPAIDRLVADPSSAVRSCAGEIVLAAYPIDRAWALGLFDRLASHESDALLATPAMERAVMVLARDHFGSIESTIARMLASALPEVVAAGSRQATLASLSAAAAAEMAASVLTGTEAQRLGAAQVYAANVGTAELQDVCVAALAVLFHDGSAEVRREAASCFHEIDPGRVANLAVLVTTFVGSPAFTEQSHGVFRALASAPDAPVETILAAGERFVEVFGIAAGNMATAASADARTVSTLAVRAHSQAPGSLQDRALDLIDRLLAIGAYGMVDALTEFER